jgi:hypothetical protein
MWSFVELLREIIEFESNQPAKNWWDHFLGIDSAHAAIFVHKYQ